MIVKLLAGLSGPAFDLKPGDQYDCPADEAGRLVSAGIAEFMHGAVIERTIKPARRERATKVK